MDGGSGWPAERKRATGVRSRCALAVSRGTWGGAGLPRGRGGLPGAIAGPADSTNWRGLVSGEGVSERGQEPPLRRPVRDGEDDLPEASREPAYWLTGGRGAPGNVVRVVIGTCGTCGADVLVRQPDSMTDDEGWAGNHDPDGQTEAPSHRQPPSDSTNRNPRTRGWTLATDEGEQLREANHKPEPDGEQARSRQDGGRRREQEAPPALARGQVGPGGSC